MKKLFNLYKDNFIYYQTKFRTKILQLKKTEKKMNHIK